MNQRETEVNYRRIVDGPPTPYVPPDLPPVTVDGSVLVGNFPSGTSTLNMQNVQNSHLFSLDAKTANVDTSNVEFAAPQPVTLDDETAGNLAAVADKVTPQHVIIDEDDSMTHTLLFQMSQQLDDIRLTLLKQGA